MPRPNPRNPSRLVRLPGNRLVAWILGILWHASSQWLDYYQFMTYPAYGGNRFPDIIRDL